MCQHRLSTELLRMEECYMNEAKRQLVESWLIVRTLVLA
jgi:hypothetical protein